MRACPPARRPSEPPLVIACPDCSGLTFTLRPCGCTQYGDRFLVELADIGHGREAYQECQVCRGAGSVATACPRCRQRGTRRAQLVFTVVNLDTGAVASASVVPGTVAATRGPAGWQLDLDPLLRDLARTAGVAATRDEGPILLPALWHPELPADRREELEAQAIVDRDRDPWRVTLGRTEPPAAPDPGRRLGQLCAVADLLLLDLVVEARRRDYGDLIWEVRYELPGGDVPAAQRTWLPDLPTALAATDVTEALVDLDVRGRTAPAHLLRADPPNRVCPVWMDADQLERRIFADSVDLDSGGGLPGAQAIWRDGRWWHTGLLPGGRTELLTERDTGQVVRHRPAAPGRTAGSVLVGRADRPHRMPGLPPRPSAPRLRLHPRCPARPRRPAVP